VVGTAAALPAPASLTRCAISAASMRSPCPAPWRRIPTPAPALIPSTLTGQRDATTSRSCWPCRSDQRIQPWRSCTACPCCVRCSQPRLPRCTATSPTSIASGCLPPPARRAALPRPVPGRCCTARLAVRLPPGVGVDHPPRKPNERVRRWSRARAEERLEHYMTHAIVLVAPKIIRGLRVRAGPSG
jgi:hypothetical protein